MDDLKEELSNYSFTIYKQILQHWDITQGGWIVYFDLRNNLSDLIDYLSNIIKKKVNFDPIFAFKSKRVFNSSQDKEDSKGKQSLNKKKYKKYKAFYLEVLSIQKVTITLLCAYRVEWKG